MKVSVIVAVYKNVNALELILQSMQRQTYTNFELVVAEDDQSIEIKNLINRYKDIEILHVSHPDNGLQKNIIQNKAIVAATGEYLIFIDGDCIPYSNFIEQNIKLAQKRRVLSGRRVNLPENISKDIYMGKISSESIEKHYLWYGLKGLAWDKSIRYEQGICLDVNGLFYSNFLSKRKRNCEILGCNFSCYKEDMIGINGFDESYGETILGDDTDLTWRFIAYGAEIVSSKNIANVFHLYHPPRPQKNDPKDLSHLLKRFETRKLAKHFIVEKEYGVSKYRF